MAKNSERSIDGIIGGYENLLSMRRAELEKVAISLGPPSKEYKNAETKLGEKKEAMEFQSNSVGGRPPHISFENQWLFWTLTSIVGVTEIGTNKVLVDMALLLPSYISILVSAVLSCALLLLSHWAGHSARQVWSESRQKWIVSNILWWCGTALTVVGLIVVMMVLRASFANAENFSGGLGNVFGDVANSVKNVGFWGLIWQTLSTPEAAILGAFNLICTLAAFLAGFISHDSDLDYDMSYIQHKKVEDAFYGVRKKYESMIENVHGKYAKKIENQRAAFVEANSRLASSDEKRELRKDDFAADRAEAEKPTMDNAKHEDSNKKTQKYDKPTLVKNPVSRGKWHDNWK